MAVAVASWRAGELRLDVGADGFVCGLCDMSAGGRDRRHPDRRSPLLCVGVHGALEPPAGARADGPAALVLTYGSGRSVRIAARCRAAHVSLEVEGVEGGEVDAVVWGPYATDVGDVVGETVGISQAGDVAIGLQALNYWTLAGVPGPWAEAPALPTGAEVRPGYAECAAWPVEGGSLLQAHALRRPPDVPDGGVVGSAIALFLCRVAEALDVVGRVEVDEGLPHPTLGGGWAKQAPEATRSYLIAGFGEADVEELLGYAEAAGVGSLYHGDPFETWGHFALKREAFPDGDASLRRCSQAAARRGLRLGVHTLTNFITTRDAYVTPVPHPHLQRRGTARLAQDVGDSDDSLVVDDPASFRQPGWLGAAVVGEEIVRCTGVSEAAPWRLLDCERGAFGTRAAPHAAGSAVGKLADHGYRVLFPDIHLQDALADRLVELFNAAEIGQTSFDGLEGCRETGHPQFADNRFVLRCFQGWRREVVSDASLLTHFGWHLHTRMNWGEPWGAAIREGMADYRFANQRYFVRNLFPRMLGWFLVRLAGDFEATTLDDIEWVLARCAGYDAGCAVVADLATLRGNGNAAAMLGAVRNWEAARLAGAFTAAQRGRLRDAAGEWHLEPDGTGSGGAYRMRPMQFSAALPCLPSEAQPGQPGGADWRFRNDHGPQPLRFRLRVMPPRGAADGTSAVVDPGFSLGGRAVVFRGEVPAGSYLVCDGARDASVCDGNWRPVRTLRGGAVPEVARGDQSVSFSCGFAGGPPAVTVRLITAGAWEPVGGAAGRG